MTRLRQILPILAACALSVACGDYSGGKNSSNQESFVIAGGAGLGGLSSAEQVTTFTGTVYPLLRDNCSECHSGSGPGTPHIAHANPSVAYSAVVDNQKVNFSLTSSSRIVRRVATDFHFCWTNCIENGAEMLFWVNAWDAALEEAGVAGGGGGVDVAVLASDVRNLEEDGDPDEGGDRYDENIIAKWDFTENIGNIAFDQSGVAPAMDLTLEGTEWMDNYGIEIPADARAFADEDDSIKLFERIAEAGNGTGEYSVEAWVIPGNTTQDGESGPARIVTYSRGTGSANFTLGQNGYQYAFRNRSVAEGVSNRGEPVLETYAEDEDLQDTLQHVVITFDRFSGRRIYVDGLFTDDEDEQETGRLWNWETRSRLVLGDDTSPAGNHWLGKIRFLAIYDRALNLSQVQQNFNAGVGKRFTLSFDVSEWAGSETYLDFSVTQFDQYSYLFCQPTFRGSNAAGLRVENIRIQVNDSVPVEGQAFSNVDDTVLAEGQPVSRLCSIIRSELGRYDDDFKIVFEQLGRFQSPIDPNVPDYVIPISVLPDAPVIGIRDFARVNETMATLTGVDPRTPAVLDAYVDLVQQLPSTSDVRSFVSSHQVGISRLAFEYCHEMVEGDTSLRDAFFGTAFQFDFTPAMAFGGPMSVERDLIVDPLVKRMIHQGTVELVDQGDMAAVRADVDQLITEMMVCTLTPCDADRTVNIVKAACTAVLAGAGVMIH